MTYQTNTSESIHTCYLFSVINNCVSPQHRGESEFSDENLLERMRGGGSFNWDEIQSAFPKVWERTKIYADSNGLDPKSREAALGYWLLEHNRIIQRGVDEYEKMPKPMKDACMTYLAKVLSLKNGIRGVQKIEVLDDTGLTREVVDFYHGDINPGDYITFHELIVCQKISEQQYQNLLQKRKEYGT